MQGLLIQLSATAAQAFRLDPLFLRPSSSNNQPELGRIRLSALLADFFEGTHFCSILFLQSIGWTKLAFVIETDPLLLIPSQALVEITEAARAADSLFRGGPTFARSRHTHNAFAAHPSSMGGSNKIVEFGKYRKRPCYGFWPIA